MFNLFDTIWYTLESGAKYFKKHKTKVFMHGGMALTTAGTVAACVATYKHVDRILDTTKEKMEAANEAENPGKEKLKAAGYCAFEFGKAYALSFSMITLGNLSIKHADSLHEQKEELLGNALTNMTTAYVTLKKRAEEKLGKEEADKIRLNSSDVEVMTDDGKKKTKETVEVLGDDALDGSPFAKFFDETCEGVWSEDPEENYSFLKMMQWECDNQLRRDGYLFLSDVYRKLGINITKASLVAGWVYNNEEISDSYVDFGIFDIHKRANRRFVNGLENVILLDFNCSSNIADYI